ncbi:CAZyme family GH81 [Penicillium riverlandense]|uniref:CAZyme family GH81 n=1 Tax=Penicillium riverlandense TaxID=1903569 RepID=UPI00254724E2|nr:CAZyme family GH81 [Penicillium riverlandense]KAJ5820525.1 CAZyme family GH81 [Penicillium riverlandense]
MDSILKWKAAVLIGLLAAESSYALPQPMGSLAESILARTQTQPDRPFKTQYPPPHERISIPRQKPIYHSALERDGQESRLPFPTVSVESSPDQQSADGSVPHRPAKLRPRPRPHSSPHRPGSSGKTHGLGDLGDQDIFQPVGTGPVPDVISTRQDYPVSKKHVNATGPVETNKFYAGFFLGSQTSASFTQPYTLTWLGGGGTLKSWGMAACHDEQTSLAYGPKESNLPGEPVEYYINPTGLQPIVLSANEFANSTQLQVEQPMAFSAQAVLSRPSSPSQRIVFPVVQGMGYVTAIYSNLQPIIQSGTFFSKVVSAGSPRSGIFKYRVELNDNSSWLIYATPTDGTDPDFKLDSKANLRGPSGFSGTIQVAKNPSGASGEKFYDTSCGVYPVAGHVSGSVNGKVGTYSLGWTKSGKDVQDTPLLMFALPHHVESFDASTKAGVTDMTLRTTTKGNATAVVGGAWSMTEPSLPVDIGFAPWTPTIGNVLNISTTALKTILSVAPEELNQDIESQTNLNSMYYSGKALSKFATLVYTVNTLGNDIELAASAFGRLKSSFERFLNNTQQYPLVYDAVWKGTVSSAGYNGDLNADFGNTAYNDHHFHYGYFIQAAAIIGSLDPVWLAENKDWVNMLVRDAGNPATDDPYFPFSRSFDWFNGHSWAKGLFESFDGKDEESTSEDALFAYAVKMWGQTTGDASMEARGNMMLGIMQRSLHNYFLMENDNVNQPSNFIANKVTGILFENKVDHTTYFGSELAYIQGIHMLPLIPSSAYTRQNQFVTEEWNAMFASGAASPAENVDGGWKGILYANLAIINPTASWEFFAQSNFSYSWLDGGASRTWYLAYAAGLGGVP